MCFLADLLGELAGHNVVVACLPAGIYGTTFAAVVATQMRLTFPAIRIGLMVGIGGGVPSLTTDIRLGDVVVSQPQGQFSGVVQYDAGKTIASGHFERTGTLNMPPAELLTALAKVQANRMVEGNTRLQSHISKAVATETQTGLDSFRRPAEGHDHLYDASYTHESSASDCASCDRMRVLDRRPRTSEEPHIHYGTIASGNQVMKNAQVRDQLASQLGILCFEMEAAGLMNHFPSLVVRGICDYADSHKNKEWQRYAALAAAAFAKELLCEVPVQADTGGITGTNGSFSVDEFEVRFRSIDMPPVRHFVGREAEMAKIKRAFQPDSANQTVVLHGISGIGKTQIALAYVMQNLDAYSAIFWLDASDEDRLACSFLEMADRITKDHDSLSALQKIVYSHNATAAIPAIKEWLSLPGNDRWLMVYDCYEVDAIVDADDQSEICGLRKFLPDIRQGHILITTTRPGVKLGTEVAVGKLHNTEQSLDILSQTSERPDLRGEPSVHDLIMELDGFPQALASVGAYLKNSNISCRDYLENYQAQWSEQVPGNLPPTYPVHVAWEITMKEISRKHTNAAYLANYWCFFSNQDIWAALLRRGGSSRLADIGRNLATFVDSMRVLCEYGFAEVGTDTTSGRINGVPGYCMHKCVHQWLYSVNSRTPLFHEQADEVLHCVALYACHNRGSLPDCRQILPHADRCLQLIKWNVMGQNVAQNSTYGRLYSWLAEYYLAASRWVTGKSGLSSVGDDAAPSQGSRLLMRYGFSRIHRYIAESHASDLDYLGVPYPEKRHLTKVEELCLLALQTTAASPADDYHGRQTRLNAYINLMIVYDRKGNLLKSLKFEYKMLYLQCQTSVKKWYQNKPFLLSSFLLFCRNFILLKWWYFYWVVLVLSIIHDCVIAFSTGFTHQALSAALILGIWISWFVTIRGFTARWVTLMLWAGLVIASGTIDGWVTSLKIDVGLQLFYLAPILIYEGFG
ncbi:unnamed protein product [Penicillium palitans]